MKRIISALLLIFALLQVSCSEENIVTNINDSELLEAMIEYNSPVVDNEINKVTGDLKAKSDRHKSNLETLVERIEGSVEEIKVTDFKNEWIRTFPPVSIIVLEIDSLGTAVSRTLNISSPSEEALNCLSVSEF